MHGAHDGLENYIQLMMSRADREQKAHSTTILTHTSSRLQGMYHDRPTTHFVVRRPPAEYQVHMRYFDGGHLGWYD